MARKYIKRKNADSDGGGSIRENANPQEFYLMEKLYHAMRNDKKRHKQFFAAREFYLMEKLHEAMRNDKNRAKINKLG